MKKYVCWILALLMLTSMLTGCSSTNATPTAPAAPKENPPIQLSRSNFEKYFNVEIETINVEWNRTSLLGSSRTEGTATIRIKVSPKVDLKLNNVSFTLYFNSIDYPWDNNKDTKYTINVPASGYVEVTKTIVSSTTLPMNEKDPQYLLFVETAVGSIIQK